jgi:hypothetical protein
MLAQRNDDEEHNFEDENTNAMGNNWLIDVHSKINS